MRQPAGGRSDAGIHRPQRFQPASYQQGVEVMRRQKNHHFVTMVSMPMSRFAAKHVNDRKPVEI